MIEQSAYWPASHVRWASINQRAVLLCLRSGTYLGLNESGTLIWIGLWDRRPPAQICADIAESHGIGVDTVIADYTTLMQQLRERHLVVPEGTVHAPRPVGHRTPGHPLPLALRAWRWQVAIAARLRFRGFSSAYEFAASYWSLQATRPAATLKRCLAAFGQAEKFSNLAFSRLDCLPRSLSLFVFLRECGLAPEHHIGVADDPLRVHAWVELDGALLLDSTAHIQRHTRIARLS